MGYSDLEEWSGQLKRLTPTSFSSLFREIRLTNGAAAFNNAFFAPEQLTAEETLKYFRTFKEHGISIDQFDVRAIFLLLMAEAAERGATGAPLP